MYKMNFQHNCRMNVRKVRVRVTVVIQLDVLFEVLLYFLHSIILLQLVIWQVS